MRKFFMITLLALSLPVFLSAQSEEVEAIQKALNYYLDGGTNNDFETLKKAFHPDAKMQFDRDGFQSVNAVEYFGKIMKPGPKQNRKTEIIYVDYAGPVAHAKLKLDYGKVVFYDYMNLVKVDGEWKIVNKIFHRERVEE